MSHQEIATCLIDEVSRLREQLGENTLSARMDDLSMIEDENNQRNDVDGIEKQNLAELSLLDEIDKVQRKRGSWLTEEQYQTIVRLLNKYPGKHKVIKKRLGLSQSTLHRIQKQATGSAYLCQQAKRKQRNEDRIDEKQRLYLTRLLAPPTTPMTIPFI